jgi:hypothetical protein
LQARESILPPLDLPKAPSPLRFAGAVHKSLSEKLGRVLRRGILAVGKAAKSAHPRSGL